MKHIFLLILSCLFFNFNTPAQKIAIKTNALYDAAFQLPTFNAEINTGNYTSIELMVSYSPFKYGENKRWKAFILQPSFRYWLNDSHKGFFGSIHAQWGIYNLAKTKVIFGIMPDLKNFRYQGSLWGAGIGFGYRLPITKHFSTEFELGIGLTEFNYKKYKCSTCGNQKAHEIKHFMGPDKTAVNIVYQF